VFSPGGDIKVIKSADGREWSPPVTVYAQKADGGMPKVGDCSVGPSCVFCSFQDGEFQPRESIPKPNLNPKPSCTCRLVLSSCVYTYASWEPLVASYTLRFTFMCVQLGRRLTGVRPCLNIYTLVYGYVVYNYTRTDTLARTHTREC
jgi:hypothetical protein